MSPYLNRSFDGRTRLGGVAVTAMIAFAVIIAGGVFNIGNTDPTSSGYATDQDRKALYVSVSETAIAELKATAFD